MQPSLEGSKAAGGSLGRRPPPPPPSSTASDPFNEESFIPVDNLALSFIEAYFHEADADGDDRVADEEARNFFLRTGLSPSDLSTIWKIVKPSTAVAQQGKGLTKRRFSQALRLIALAQQGMPLTPELATAALFPETWLQKGYEPLPAPTIAPLPPPPKGFFEGLLGVEKSEEDEDAAPLVDVDIRGIDNQEQQQQQVVNLGFQVDGPVALSRQQPETTEDAIVTGLEFLGIEQPVRGAVTMANTAEGEYGGEQAGGGEEDLLGLGTRQEEGTFTTTTATTANTQESHPPSVGKEGRPSFGSVNSGMKTRSLMRTSVLQSLTRDSRNFISTSLEAPLAYELRYPPLNPKDSARLNVLIGSNGSLFAGPSAENGLLQWSMPEGEKKVYERLDSDLRATHESKHPVPTEDADASFSAEIPGTSPGRSRPATCLLADEARGILWIGDKDGWVVAYDITGRPGNILDPGTSRLHSWQAHRVGTIAAMCLSSTGELWTGSSRGTIRIWRLQGLHSYSGYTGSASKKKKEKYSSTGSAGASTAAGLNRTSSGIGATGTVGKARELRRPAGERAHSGAIVSMVCSADGQLVWTASRSGIVLWDAYSGAYLGFLSKDIVNTPTVMSSISNAAAAGVGLLDLNPLAAGGAGAGGGYTATATGSFTSTAPSNYSITSQQAFLDGRINVSSGLDLDPSHGAVISRPSISERERMAVQQEAWAAQSERGVAEFAERFSEGAGRAVKLIGKIGAKLGVLSGGGGGGGGGPSTSGGGTSGSPATTNAPPAASDISSDGGAAPIEQQTTLSGGDIVSLVASLDNNQIWVGYRQGFIERYTAAGKLQFARKFGGKIHTMAPVGRKLWVGFTNGMLSVLGPDGTGLKAFLGHKAGIVAIAPAGKKTFTLAADGSINGWSSAIPCLGDEEALGAWHKQASSTFVRESINVLAVTWNCGESRPESSSPIFRWLHEHGFDKSLVVVGLQEVEMGGTSVALAAAKNALASRLQEKGNANAQFWSTAMLNALGGDRHWHQVGLRQLSGMLIVAFARNNLRGHIGEVSTASVACGVLGVGGNKGAVAVEFTLHRQKIAVVCSHFAAHQNAVKARNSNYAVISKLLTFNRRAGLGGDDDDYYVSSGDQVGVMPGAARRSHVRTTSSSSSKEVPLSSNTTPGGSDLLLISNSSEEEDIDIDLSLAAEESLTETAITVPPNTTVPTSSGGGRGDDTQSSQVLLQGEGLRCADALIWLGDFNYRIDGQYDQVKELAISGNFGPLLACDQLRREMVAGNVFRGLREGNIAFPPTYKFDKGIPSPAAYDSSEKRRVPAWCDRIFYRGSIPFATPFNTDEEDEDTRFSNCCTNLNKINHSSSSPTRLASATENNKNSDGDGDGDEFLSDNDSDNRTSNWLDAAGAGTGTGPEEICVRAREYGCWSDVYDSDHRPVYASLQVSLPVTNASKKRDLISDLVNKYAPPELILGCDAEPEVTVSPGTVKVHPIHMPDQMVLLSNNGVANLSFTVLIDGDNGGNSSGSVLGSSSTSTFNGGHGGSASSHVEVRPVSGFVRAGSEAEIRIRASPGGAGSYASSPREVVVRILLATEYGRGGPVVEGEGRGEVEFTASVLPEFALDDSF
ncbi:hypothetical protein Ndes2437B_g03641 [Nannochloris sp. 'desiccata']